MESFSAIAVAITMPILASVMAALLAGAAVFAILEHKGVKFTR